MKENEKQAIEEMARIIGAAIEFDELDFGMDEKTEIIAEKAAKAFYNAGYRKQSVGEWVKTKTHSYCSACKGNVISWSGEYDGYECERGISLMKFCPNCGANMKGVNNDKAD